MNIAPPLSFDRPTVAIPIPHDYFERQPLWGNAGGYRSVNEIAEAVRQAGGEPQLLFPGDELGEFNALIFPGGGDIDPEFYRQQAQPDVVDTDPELDLFQLKLARQALEDGTPLLGICRGMQLLNVAAGGSLIQHLESTATHFPEEVRQDATLRPVPVHDIVMDGDSRLASVIGGTKVAVNSLHHQAVDRLAPTFRAVAHSHDDTIEAIEGPGRYQLGVQFHPEDLRHTNKQFQELFTELVAQARL